MCAALAVTAFSLTIPVCAQIIDVNLTSGNVTAGPGFVHVELFLKVLFGLGSFH